MGKYITNRLLKLLGIILLFPLLAFSAQTKFAPIMVDDIIIFVPYSEVTVSLGGDKTLGQDQVQTLSASITNPDQVASYSWTEGSTVLGTDASFSTTGLSVGTHSITLTVTDENGLTSSDTVVITIEDGIDEYDLTEDSTFVGTTKGEFSVNQGTASYSLKIDVPPGVAGMEPKLSLNYSSGAGNGYMGVGWNMGGVSAITRCPQSKAIDGDSHKFGVNYNRNDRFCLDGQRLIAVNGYYGAAGTEYKTEIDTYAKIVSRGDYYSGPRHFEVQTKSGLTYIYGLATDTYEHTTPGHALKSWKVDKILDTYGNAIAFHYAADHAIGVHRLSYVTYADNRVEYVYEDRDDVLKGYHAGYRFRVDKRLKTVVVKTGSTEVRRYAITYKNDQTGRAQSKLTSITEHVAEGNLETLHVLWNSTDVAYLFDYAFPDNTNIAVDGSNNYPYIYTPDMNGDGLSDICYRDDTGIKCFINHGGTFNASPEIDTALCSNNHSGCSSHNNWDTIRFVDMDADGLQDLVYRSDTGIRIWKSTGSGLSFLASNAILSGDRPNSSENNWKYLYTPDTNGDGLADICYRADNGIKCYVNQGAGVFDDNTPSIDTPICANGSTEDGTCNDESNWDTIRFVDMDADGLQDLVYRSDEGMRIWKSYGHGFGFHPSHSSTLIKNSYKETNFGNFLRDEWKYIYTPDMNGDGLPDLCYRSYEGMKCYTNRGGNFSNTASITTSICADGSTLDGTCNDSDNYQTIRFVDTDADGLVDLTYRSDDGMRIWKNKGNALATSPKTSSILANHQDSFGYNDHDNWSTKGYFDVNGDGIQDLYYRSDSGIVVSKNTSLQSYVTRFSNSTDQDIGITYKPMTNPAVSHNYAVDGHRNDYGFNDIANGNIELNLPMPLVYTVDSNNGVGGTNHIRYKYYGYIINKLRGVQGFHAINTFDDTAQMYSTTYYKQIGVKFHHVVPFQKQYLETHLVKS